MPLAIRGILRLFFFEFYLLNFDFIQVPDKPVL